MVRARVAEIKKIVRFSEGATSHRRLVMAIIMDASSPLCVSDHIGDITYTTSPINSWSDRDGHALTTWSSRYMLARLASSNPKIYPFPPCNIWVEAIRLSRKFDCPAFYAGMLAMARRLCVMPAFAREVERALPKFPPRLATFTGHPY